MINSNFDGAALHGFTFGQTKNMTNLPKKDDDFSYNFKQYIDQTMNYCMYRTDLLSRYIYILIYIRI